MSEKVAIQKTTLEAIGDAIRAKEESTEVIPVTALADRITALPTSNENPLVPFIERTAYKLTAKEMEGVTKIGNSAFSSNYNLVSVEIPEQVTSIGSSAFNYCQKLVEIINKSALNIVAGETGSSHGYIGRYALEVHSGESRIADINGYLFFTKSDGTNYLVNYVGTDAELNLPDFSGKTYNINQNAFISSWQNENIKKVIIPDTVESIGEGAFRDCNRLAKVEIGNGVTEIAMQAFYRCYSLTNVTLGNSVTSIGQEAFADTKFTTIIIPDSCRSIGYQAFYNNTSLYTVEIGNGLTTLSSAAFQSCRGIKNFSISSPISASIDFSSSTRLTIDSLKNIINALVDYSGTENEGKYKLTLNSSCNAKLDTEGATAPDGLTWSEYVSVKGWNIA